MLVFFLSRKILLFTFQKKKNSSKAKDCEARNSAGNHIVVAQNSVQEVLGTRNCKDPLQWAVER